MGLSEKKKTRHREYLRVRYQQDTNYREQHKALVRQRQNDLRKWFRDYKATLACPCGEKHPGCLDFHHTAGKELNLAKAVSKGWGKKRILAEIAKCSVLCSNCHRKLHWQDDSEVEP